MYQSAKLWKLNLLCTINGTALLWRSEFGLISIQLLSCDLMIIFKINKIIGDWMDIDYKVFIKEIRTSYI